jgi:hypothetical protein
MKSLLAIALLFFSSGLSAVPACPSSHFQPATYFGAAMYQSSPVTEYRFPDSKDDLELSIIEYGKFELGYEPVVATSIFKSETGKYRAALVRAKAPKDKLSEPVAFASFRELPALLAKRAQEASARALRNTHYPKEPCTDLWLDGHVVQALVPNVEGFGDLVGEVYIPTAESEAGAVAALGQTLRGYVEGKATLKELESAVLALERHN